MTRSRDVADTQDNSGGAVAPVVSGKNFAINGGFDFAQRGASFSVTTSAFYTLDRWYASGSGGSTVSVVSQQTTGPSIGTSAQVRVAYSTNTTFCNLFSPLEYANLQAMQGRVCTLSFKGRRSAGFLNGLVAGIQTGTVANTLTGGTWTEIANCVITNANLPTGTTSSDWGSASVSFLVPAGTQGLRIRLGEEVFQPNGAYWEAGAVQLEIGAVATPFARAGGSIGGELALCQRYYYRTTATQLYSDFASGYNASASEGSYIVPFPVQMRTTPTALEQTGVASNYNILHSSGGSAARAVCSSVPTYQVASQNAARVYFIVPGTVTAGQGSVGGSSNNTVAFLGWSAEL